MQSAEAAVERFADYQLVQVHSGEAQKERRRREDLQDTCLAEAAVWEATVTVRTPAPAKLEDSCWVGAARRESCRFAVAARVAEDSIQAAN